MTDIANRDRRDRLLSLQVGRGLAAVGVVLHHARIYTDVYSPAPEWLARIIQNGFLGVDFFFVLSGFIMLDAHFDDPANLQAAISYAWKRVSRIYIPYWPVCAALISAYLLFPTLSTGYRPWGWTTSIFLVPSQYPPALGLAWTLVHEVMFYVIFLLFFLDRRVFALAVLAWVAVILLGPAADTVAQPLMSTLLRPINLEFVLGLIAAIAYRVLPRGFGWGAGAAGIIVMIWFFSTRTDYLADSPLFGLASSLVVLGGALLEPRIRWCIPRMLVGLGDASYAIYLVHLPLMALSARAAVRIPGLGSWPACLAFIVACGIAGGYAYHHLFEKPALARFRALERRHRAAAREACAGQCRGWPGGAFILATMQAPCLKTSRSRERLQVRTVGAEEASSDCPVDIFRRSGAPGRGPCPCACSPRRIDQQPVGA
jgi:exopolysaccharide production protein ExoZ